MNAVLVLSLLGRIVSAVLQFPSSKNSDDAMKSGSIKTSLIRRKFYRLKIRSRRLKRLFTGIIHCRHTLMQYNTNKNFTTTMKTKILQKKYVDCNPQGLQFSKWDF